MCFGLLLYTKTHGYSLKEQIRTQIFELSWSKIAEKAVNGRPIILTQGDRGWPMATAAAGSAWILLAISSRMSILD